MLLFISVFLTCFSACSDEPEKVLTADQIEPGTAGMVKALAYFKANVVETQTFLIQEEQKEKWWRRKEKSDDYELIQSYRSIVDVLATGDIQKGIDLLDSVRAEMQKGSLPKSPMAEFKFSELTAVAWLRLAEVNNCIDNHGNETCIFPIQGDGIYTTTDATLKAIAYLEEGLRVRENHPGLRWLLNLAHMTIDQYPDSVPGEWLIPPEALASDTLLPAFKNKASQLGLDVDSHSGGAIMDDFNNDGFLDVIFSGLYLDNQLEYFINNQKGGFKSATKAAGLTGITGGLNIVQTDYNNDGHLDIFIPRGAWGIDEPAGRQPNSLLKNNGDGTFEDVTKAAGVLSFYPTQTAVWADFNHDGWLDLFIGNESENHEYPCELFLNNQDGTFTEVADKAGLNMNLFVKGATAGDYNNDGLTDLFISGLRTPNHLYQNMGLNKEGLPYFEDITEKSGVGALLNSFSTWFWDYNNDGWEDLMVLAYESRQSTSEIALSYLNEPVVLSIPALYKNNGDGTFQRVTEEANLVYPLVAMGANFGDINNDGYQDMYIGTGAPPYQTVYPNRMFLNRKGQRFIDVTTTTRVGHVQKGHGIAFGDLDNDGDQDILAEMGGYYRGDPFRNAVYENPGNEHQWITLDLRGVTSNRKGIGTRIKVTIDEKGKQREIHRTVSSGGSFGANSLQQEIGLGQADAIVSLEIWWPASDTRQSFKNLEMKQFYEVTEGEQQITKLQRKAIQFPESLSNEHARHHVH
jgi:hypothetical protein